MKRGFKMPLHIVRNDITKMKVDVIVNAANSSLKMGGGVCGAIFRAAGENQLQDACDEIGTCAVGHAVMTEAFKLNAKYIIHSVGPIWRGGTSNEADLLASCYENSLKLAAKNKCQSIAFPLISSGIYGYPKREALQIAVSSISSFLLNNDMEVYIVVFDKQAVQLSEKLFHSIQQFIDDHYEEELVSLNDRRENFEQYQVYSNEKFSEAEESLHYSSERSLEDVLTQLGETFSERLLRLIDEKGKTDVETYKSANVDRRLFSKIRNKRDYTPHKKTVLAFAIALELNIDETIDLLSTAGYTLSNSSKFDVIIKFFITNKNYNIFEINEALFTFDQELLGA